jgi:signal transduction histidine kinase/FixJ family two-component response regulator
MHASCGPVYKTHISNRGAALRRGVLCSHRAGASAELLHRSGSLVTRAMKRSDRTAILGAAQPARPSRRPPEQRGPLATPLAADAAFHAVFNSSSEALVVVNSAGMIQHANPRASEMLCLTDPSAAGNGLGEFLGSANSNRGASSWTRLFAAAHVQTLEAVLPNGIPIRFILRSSMPETGDMLLCVEEGSIAQRADARWRQLEDKLLQTEKMAALGHLVSGIAHELNNPLTAIMGYAQLLLGHGLGPQQLSEAEKVYQEAERARRIVKNLLYFARENKTERTRVDLNEIVKRTLALRSYELKVEDITVESDLDRSLPATVADPYQLQQIVLNLLVNAEQALLEERGKGNVRIRTRHSAEAAGGRIFLEVSDDGPGIPAANTSRIFDPFFTTKPPGVGTGLGLSIVYGIVKQHGGEVTFENQPDAGVKFTVDLPLVAPDVADERLIAPYRPDHASVAPRGRILVVEDEPTVAQLIVDVLAEEGHHAEAALDSQDGLTRLARNLYDLVICDLRMPRLDGPAFYDALVRTASPVRDKILFITGDTLAHRTVEFLEPNALPYLAKPFLVEELKLAVNSLLVSSPSLTANAATARERLPKQAGKRRAIERN